METLESFLIYKDVFKVKPKLSLFHTCKEGDYYITDIYGTSYIVLLKKTVQQHYKNLSELLNKLKKLLLAEPIQSFFSHILPIYVDVYLTGEYIFIYKIISPDLTLIKPSSIKFKHGLFKSLFKLYNFLHSNNYYMYYVSIESFFMFGEELGIIDLDNIQQHPVILNPVYTSVYLPHKTKVKVVKQNLLPVSDVSKLFLMYETEYRINFFKQICLIMSSIQTVKKCSEICVIAFIDEDVIHKKICKQNTWTLEHIDHSLQIIKNRLF